MRLSRGTRRNLVDADQIGFHPSLQDSAYRGILLILLFTCIHMSDLHVILHLCLIRLNLNVLHAFHLEILCSRKSMFFLQVVSKAGLGLGLHVLKQHRSDYDMHKLIRCRSKVDLGMISLDLDVDLNVYA